MCGYFAKMKTNIILVLLSVSSIVCGGASIAKASPQRIVSLNLCTDQLLMMLVEPSRIAAVSYFARRPNISAMAAVAAKLRITHGKAEEIFLLKPDLVLVGSYTSRTTVNLLRKLKQNMVVVAPSRNFEDIFKNIKIIGKAVGENAKAAKLVGELQAQLRKLAAAGKPASPLAALYFANGYSSGKNTLIDGIVRKGGFSTLGEKLAFAGTRKISLETLILARPDVLVVEQKRYAGEAVAYEVFKHPAMRHLKIKAATISLSNALMICGTPKTVKALETLQKFHDKHFTRPLFNHVNEGGK